MENVTKVKQLEHANQFIMENEKEVIFQSYRSIIAVYNKEKDILTLGKDWKYLRTTLKHLYVWLNKIFATNSKSQYCIYILALDEKSNKKEYIKKLININIIKYDEKLK